MSGEHDSRDRSPAGRAGAPGGGDEFPLGIGTPVRRRSFLQAAGFAVAGVGLAACRRAPVEKAIPFLVQPEEITLGRAYHHASTCTACPAGCGLLVACRDGRPIKLEGLPGHPISRGGLCAVGQAALLGLYDAERLRSPQVGGRAVDWPEADAEVAAGLARAAARGGRVRLLTGAPLGPTLAHWCGRFLGGFADGRLVAYEPLPASAILAAHERTHGVRRLPRYRFEHADAVVAFGADFLGTWISPVEFTRGWSARRRLAGESPALSWHAQLEPRLSLTGGKADRRARLLPSEYGAAVGRLAAGLAARAGVTLGWSAPELELPAVAALVAEAEARLWAARGHALVVSDSQELAVQLLVNLANHLLGAYGTTVDLDAPSRQRVGDDAALTSLLAEIEAGEVDALLVHEANPVYELPGGERLAAALSRVPLVVSFARERDETARLAHVLAPVPHPLEAWGDAEAVAGVVGLLQPTVAGLGQGREAATSLAAWAGEPAPAHELVHEVWRREIHLRAVAGGDPESFWEQSLHDGFARVAPRAEAPASSFAFAAVPPPRAAAISPDLELVLYPKVSQLDGRHAHNPWLQELPDPVSKITWENYACLAPATAARLGVAEGDLVRVVVDGLALELPAHLAPGQDERAVAIALGYGRAGTERFTSIGPRWWFGRPTVRAGEAVGRNAAPLSRLAHGALRLDRPGARVERLEGRSELACTQQYHSLTVPAGMAPPGAERRPVVEVTTLAAFLADPRAGASPAHPEADLWPPRPQSPGPRWGMAIDLTACTGCAACVVSCQAENNVPVVGRDEVRRQREMHWIRIDRYYEGEGDDVALAQQPMLCQHCANAPCETVCPVLATVHSADGLNQQVYNRCVGTRYCANNCPYKVRRFNWFDYPRADRLANMALNPDVVVRSRGVMEKCSLCVQRIQEAKAESRRLGRPVADGDVATACEQSCPAEAIVFGDLADPASRVARAAADPRHYHVLAELHVKPVVGYLRLVRHRDEAAPPPAGREDHRHG
ncbi:MAG: 4Fe-4S dicluster domain-containing protein [Thermoanaerobaculia bacterium]|nr:4Fe-4S dicluster domain-containing protein [Thermoanaerobaculia bacterium]